MRLEGFASSLQQCVVGDDLMDIEVALYKSLKAVQSLHLPVGVSASGKKFEDHMVMRLFQKLQQEAELGVFPPRHTLREATFSGVPLSEGRTI